MHLKELNPYVRFARRQEFRFAPTKSVARDHRIFIVEKGCAEFFVEDRSYRLERDDVIFWRSGLEYQVELEPDTVVSGCNFDFLWNENTELLPISPSKGKLTEPVLEKETFSDTPLFDSVFCVRNTYGILPKFHELYEEYESRQLLWEQRCGALLKDILVLCLRFSASNPASGSAWVTKEVLGYIRQNYQKPLNNETFSQLFHYHPNHISELVKSQTGLPLHKYIRTYRIYAAVDLLQSTDLPVAQIADRVGFGDVQQFSKAFKQVLGVPPSSYRK